MQFTEKVKNGLDREVEVVFPASTLLVELNNKIAEAKDTVQLKGFRKGKVPQSYLRNTYGKSFMAEIINNKIANIATDLQRETGEKLAIRPEISLSEDEQILSNIIKCEEDLVVNVKYQILPKIEAKDFTNYEISRSIVEVSTQELDKQLDQLLASVREFESKDGPAALGDRLTLDYVGKIDGKAFDNGSDKDAQLVLGSKNFIPGFEEQLVDVKAGEEKTINVSFPKNYGAADLAGKDASFDVHIKKVEAPLELVVNDDAAKKLGVESLDKLRELVKGQLENRYGSVTRQKVKKQILDLLAADYDFEVPSKLVELEYENIQGQFKQEGQTLNLEDETEYKDIAQRRVRLGLLIAQLAQDANIDVSKEEMQRAMFQQMQHFPGHEKEIMKLFQTNAEAMASLRVPILEDKVIDYILNKAKVSDEIVTSEELMNEEESELVKEASAPKKTTRSKKTKE